MFQFAWIQLKGSIHNEKKMKFILSDIDFHLIFNSKKNLKIIKITF